MPTVQPTASIQPTSSAPLAPPTRPVLLTPPVQPTQPSDQPSPTPFIEPEPLPVSTPVVINPNPVGVIADIPAVVTETEAIEPTYPVLARVVVESTHVVSGKQIKAAIWLSATDAYSNAVVKVTLPIGLDYVNKSSKDKDVEFDPVARTLTWRSIGKLKNKRSTFGDFKIDVSVSDVPTVLVLQTSLTSANLKDVVTLSTDLNVGVEKQSDKINKSRGGQFRVTDKITLDFPADALAADQTVTATAFAQPKINKRSHKGWRLELGPEQTFKQPVTLTMDLAAMLSPDLLAHGFEPRLVYLQSEDIITDALDADGNPTKVKAVHTKRVAVRSVYDPIMLRLTAWLDHFSTYEVVAGLNAQGAPQPWKLSSNLGSVGLYRGSANFGQPIAVPPMQDGLQPNLALSYSSAAADGGGRDDNNLGVGWSMEVPNIRQGIKFQGQTDQFWNVDGCGCTTFSLYFTVRSDNDYKLSLGGQEYNLIHRGNNEYTPETNAPIRAFLCFAGQTCGGEAAYPDVPTAAYHNQYWVVYTSDGVRWQMGGSGDSTKVYHARGGRGDAVGTWYLRRVFAPGRDNPANRAWSAEYVYNEKSVGQCGGDSHGLTDCGQGADYDENIRLDTVTWGNSQRANANIGKYQVKFTYDAVGFDGRPQTIDVKVWDKDATARVVRRYVLGYTWTGSNQELSSIQEQVQTGGTTWTGVPSTTLDYEGGNSGFYISAINNGYGGRQEFKYSDGSYGGKSYRKIKGLLTLNGSGWQSFKTYTYGTECFNDTDSTCRTLHDFVVDFAEQPSKSLIGHNQVEEVQRDSFSYSGAVLQTVRHKYVITDRYKSGREVETRVMDGAGTTLQSATTNFHDFAVTGMPSGVRFIAPNTVTSYPLGDGEPGIWSQQEFVYTNPLAASTGLTMFLKTVTYQRASSGVHTSVLEGYNTNVSKWLIKPTWKKTYEGIVSSDVGGAALKNQTYLVYDYNAAYADPLTRGLLTTLHTGLSPLVTQYFYYDNSTTNLNGVGQLTSVKDANGNTTTATYDDTGLMTTLTNARGHVSRYFYYCVNEGGNACTTYSQPYGALTAIRDPNSDTNGSVQTAFTYDLFGRLLKVIKPLDSEANPTVSYTYYDNYQANGMRGVRVDETIREVSGCSGCAQPSVMIADGLGRTVQTRVEKVNGTQMTVSSVDYDVFGRANVASVPYVETTTVYGGTAFWDYQVPNWASLPKTMTTYDALNRVKLVTAPDGTSTKHGYGPDTTTQGQNMGFVSTNGFVHSITDAKNHAKHYVSDGLGRTIRVRELTGTCFYSSSNCTAATKWRVDANEPDSGETRYEYDALGQLLKVTDATGNNITTMAYDGLGRKTEMVDPDMGRWTYTYDANGNLASQTDAKLQTTSFVYDPLNRVTSKSVGGTQVAWYEYDESGTGLPPGPNALGRRTAMQSLTDGTYSQWQYDVRGRLSAEQKQIANAYYSTNYGYDAADRLTSMTYPDGEVVTTAYDDSGHPLSMRSRNNYVNQALYNALGQTTQISFANTLSQRWYYYGSNLSAPHVNTGITPNNINWNYGKLRQTCVVATAAGDCWDWNVREGGSSNTQLNLYYNYDDAGNVHEVDDRDSNSVTTQHFYEYDALDRLKSWTMSGALQETYTYNAIGNMITKGAVGTLNYNARVGNSSSGRLIPHAVSDIAGSTGLVATYDANGNMARRANNTVWFGQEWNADNKMTRVYNEANPAQEIRYTYDADGARAKTLSSQPATPIADAFDTIDTSRWQTGPTPSTYAIVNQGGNNVIQVVGDGSYSWWTGGFQSTHYGDQQTVVDGQTVSIDFKLSNLHSGATLALESWVGAYYRRIGIYNWNNDLRVQTCWGITGVSKTCSNWTTDPVLYSAGQLNVNAWYRVSWVLGGSNGVQVQVKERDTNANPVSYTYTGLPSDLKWRFHFWVNTFNPTYLDNYTQRGTTTVYVGNFYEKNINTGEVTSYYYFNGQRVAMRQSQVWDMETPSMGSGGNAYQYAPAGSDWAFINGSAGGAGLTANNTAFTSLAPNAPEGNQVAFIQNNGAMQRTITTRAGRYRMNFYTTQRRNAGTGTQRLRFTVDGIEVNTVTPSSLPSYGWRSTLDFSLSAGSHTIRIQGLVMTGDETAFIDAVMLESVVWLHGDHLGSANLATGSNGVALPGSSQRYSPFGSPLVSGSGLPSQYTFTGQRSFMDFGLVEYGGGTRFYSPLLGRFLSADTVVPGAADPQSFNRYAYVRNSPMSRVDPDGHEDKTDQCGYAGVGCAQSYYQTLVDVYTPYIQQAGISFLNTVAGTWKASEMIEVIYGAVLLGLKVGGVDHLRELLGGPTVFQRVNNMRVVGLGGHGTTYGFVGLGVIQSPVISNIITVLDTWFVKDDSTAASKTVHELAHVIDFHNPQSGEIKEGIFKRSNRYSDIFPANDPITYYGKNGPVENFAEAVTDWVFGASYRPGTKNEFRNPLTTNQSEWLDKHLGGGS